MDLDMELVYGNEDYEEIQKYFEHRKFDYPSGSQCITDRLRREYIPDTLEVLNCEEKKYKISDRQRALNRILGILSQVSSDSEKSSISEASFERQD